MMYWYRQPSSGEMIYMVNIYSQSKHAREGRYSVEFYKPNQMLKLTISALTLSDSAIYFCAVREFHSEGSNRKRLTKTPRARHETATCSRRRQPTEQEEGRHRHDGWFCWIYREANECSQTNLPTFGIKERVVVTRPQPLEHFHLCVWCLSTAHQGMPLSFLLAQHPHPFLVTEP